jgi:hypothetical protein
MHLSTTEDEMKRFVFVIEVDPVSLRTEKQMVFAKDFRAACERIDSILFAWNVNPNNIKEIQEYA